jgi:hypothetical protein
MTPTLYPPARLDVVPSLTERCDRCGAAAKLAMALPTGGELTFCGHHANRHTEDILRSARAVALVEGFEWAGTARTQA